MKAAIVIFSSSRKHEGIHVRIYVRNGVELPKPGELVQLELDGRLVLSVPVRSVDVDTHSYTIPLV